MESFQAVDQIDMTVHIRLISTVTVCLSVYRLVQPVKFDQGESRAL